MGISKWNAGIIRPVPVAPTGPYESGSAPGMWTVDQQAYWQKQGLWPTAGNVPFYIEDVFSTYLYTGNGSTQTITNGIDLSTKGGLVWVKARGNGNRSHTLFDSATYTTGQYYLATNITNAFLDTGTPGTFALNSSGFSVQGTSAQWNASGESFVSWTFREQPKFFDIVTYTGDGTSSRVISHNLGSAPGCIIIKRTDSTSDWFVFHRSATQNLLLNSDVDGVGGLFYIASSAASTFTLGTNTTSNASGGTYVAYVYAHNAGGFGLTGTDNVISCGSYVGTGAANNQINLGYEPQWVLVKNVTTTGTDWVMGDIMRGMPIGGNFQRLHANLSAAEDSVAVAGWLSVYSQGIHINGTGGAVNATGDTYIYIAIRRGPMAVPTLGTSVFSPVARTGTGATANVTGVGFPPDLVIPTARTVGWQRGWYDRLRGVNKSIASDSTGAELTTADSITVFGQDGATYGTEVSVNASTYTFANWFMRRAPGFFDEVCYTGNGTNNRQISHNLGSTPEYIFVKCRNAAQAWRVYNQSLTINYGLELNAVDGQFSDSSVKLPTSTTFTVSDFGTANTNTNTYVAYLFATVSGVSKVGSYTGTGALQTVACGFTSGARFVLIKRIDTTGAWYVWDSARGITASDDPYLLLNSTAAEVTGTNYVDTDTTGFKVTAAAPAALNASGGNYIFLAIA